MGTTNLMTMLKPMSLLSQKLAVSSSSAQSAALPNNISAVRLYATQDMWVEMEGVTANGTGTTALSMFMKAGTTEYFAATPQDGTGAAVKIAAIRDTVDGNLYITPMSQ